MDDEAQKPLPQQLRESLRLLRLALRLAWEAAPLPVVGVLAILAVHAVLAPLQFVLAKALLDRLVADLGLTAETPALAARLPLAAWIAVAAAAVALNELLVPIGAACQSLVGDRLTGHVTGRILRATDRWRGIAPFEDPALADDLRRARDEATGSALRLVHILGSTALYLVTLVTTALVLVGLHPLVPVLLVAASVPLLLAHWAFGKELGSALAWQTEEARLLEYYRDSPLEVDRAKDVRLFGLQPFIARRYDALYRRLLADRDRVRSGATLRVALAGLLAGLAAAGVYLFVAREVAGGRRTLGDLALYGGAATLLQARLLELILGAAWIPRTLRFLPSLRRVLETPPDLPLPASPRPVPRPVRSGFVFEGVGFTYPGASTPVLREVSFTLGPRESLALVGSNGAGKTTVVKLLLRLYDPTAGRVLLDGVDLRDYDLDALRARTAVVFQDFVRYDLTAGENIALGDLAALGDEPRLLRAAAQGGAADLVRDLPDGLATPLGRELGGRELSTGEWQKLALARAFVREADLLVLDEPTAALDVQTEHDVYARFHDLTRGRMTLLISHRLSTVRMADRILYLEDGRIAEAGPHADLLAQDGRYARVYRLQAARYAADAREADAPLKVVAGVTDG